MTYREYFEVHGDENINWCKPYTNNTESSFIVVYDGDAMAISTPTLEAHRYDGSLNDDVLHRFAKRINQHYDVYHGWDDLHIALEMMHEVGCINCPFKDDCDVMGEEMEETDYR